MRIGTGSTKHRELVVFLSHSKHLESPNKIFCRDSFSFLAGGLLGTTFWRWIPVVLLLAAGVVRAAEIKGKVTNVVGGEPLGRVEVLVPETKATAVTSDAGEFDISNLEPGSYTLRVNAVGYRLAIIPFTVANAA